MSAKSCIVSAKAGIVSAKAAKVSLLKNVYIMSLYVTMIYILDVVFCSVSSRFVFCIFLFLYFFPFIFFYNPDPAATIYFIDLDLAAVLVPAVLVPVAFFFYI